MWGPLTIVDTGCELRVAPSADPDDWVACFAKQPGFPAQEWAERLVALYNAAPLRQRVAFGEASTPRLVSGYHPEDCDSAEPCPPSHAAALTARRA